MTPSKLSAEQIQSAIERAQKFIRVYGYKGTIYADVANCREDADVLLDVYGRLQEAEASEKQANDETEYCNVLRAELTEARINAKCPCCKDGMALALSGQEREPCQECKGTALVAIAYETCRVHYKLQGEALTEARRQLDVARKAPCAPDCASRKAVCADCYRPTGMLGACHGFGEVVNGKVLEGAQYSSHLFPHPCNCWKSQITPTEKQS